MRNNKIYISQAYIEHQRRKAWLSNIAWIVGLGILMAMIVYLGLTSALMMFNQ